MPLRSQPLLELCLRITPYTLIDDGRDRALARRAFLKLCPGARKERSANTRSM
jgi:hypothetical protein